MRACTMLRGSRHCALFLMETPYSTYRDCCCDLCAHRCLFLRDKTKKVENKMRACTMLRGSRHCAPNLMEIVLIALTATAAAITARTQSCASGEEQCFAMSSDSLCVIPKNSRTSPAQSSGSLSKGWIEPACWAMNTSRAQATTAERAAGEAHRKAGSK